MEKKKKLLRLKIVRDRVKGSANRLENSFHNVRTKNEISIYLKSS